MNTTFNQTKTWDRNAWLTFRKHVGKNLKACRKAQDLTLEDLAEVSGYSVLTLAKWEGKRANLDLYKVFCLAQALNIPPMVLLK